MSKKINIIEINGKRYDAHTGAHLDHGHHSRVARQPAKHAAHHKPQRSTTLMRRAVRKPGATSPKSHIKAQGHTGALVEQPVTEVVPKLSFGAPDDKRLRRASHIKKSDLIRHFNPNQPAYQTGYRVSVTVNQPTATPTSKPAPKTVPRQAAPDIDDIFERAIQNATSHLEPSPKKAKKRRLHLSRKHARA